VTVKGDERAMATAEHPKFEKRQVPPKKIKRSKGHGPLHGHLRPGCIVVLEALPSAEHYKYRAWKNGQTFLFLFEIENMPGHGAFVDGAGKIWWGMHLDDFRMTTEDET